jgi:hypothetical protein
MQLVTQTVLPAGMLVMICEYIPGPLRRLTLAVTETVLPIGTNSSAAEGGYGCAGAGRRSPGYNDYQRRSECLQRERHWEPPPRQPPRFWSTANVNSIKVTVSRFQPEWLTERDQIWERL